MTSIADFAYRLGNGLYKTSFPIYRVLYRTYKAYTDRAERVLLQQRLAPGSVVVDAGANIGIYSEFFSKHVGPDGTVHSFEPSPDNYQRLQERLGKLPNIRLNQLIVSDRTGPTLLYLSDELNVDHRAYSSAGGTRRSIPMQSIILDDYFKPGARVDLIKLDIQGYELHALRGAKRVLEENPEVMLLLELWPSGLEQAGTSAAEVTAFLQERNFSLYQPTSAGLVTYVGENLDPRNPSSYCNLFAKRIEKQRLPYLEKNREQVAGSVNPRWV